MDISISFADFPTEKITETTRAYRQLGIGYANLGALLMATGHADDARILRAATREWQECLRIGAENGWRNAQASLLAPTGTIGFMMDCDTTGIEPDFSLVKFKKLVGGGSMQIVNQTIPRALTSLGYQDEQVEAIVEYIAEHGHVVDAPGLRREHYEVFDCAMGARSIAPMGH